MLEVILSTSIKIATIVQNLIYSFNKTKSLIIIPSPRSLKSSILDKQPTNIANI